MKVFFVPIEPLEERYTKQMATWVEKVFGVLNAEFITLLPDSSYKQIDNGQWLDFFGTSIFRNKQMDMVVEAFSNGKVENGDIFLFGDIWYPNIETIKFLADLLGIKVFVAGWHHAGCYDPADLLHKKLSKWGFAWEKWLLEDYVDFICVGSSYHANFIKEAGVDIEDKILWKGQCWQPEEVAKYGRGVEKENIILFSHRYAEEKNPQAFFELAKKYGNREWRFVFSTSNKKVFEEVSSMNIENLEVIYNKTKEDYYKLVARSKIFYSAAYQETFGYSMHEAIALGLCLVVPNRCSYDEMLDSDPRWVYDASKDPIGERMLLSKMEEPNPTMYYYTARHKGNEKIFINKVLARAKEKLSNE